MKKAIQILFVLLFLGALGYSFYYLANKDKKVVVVYETTTPFKTVIQLSTVATGSILPRKEVSIKPQISGIVQKIFVQAGDTVKEGDLIAKIKVIPDMASLNAAETRVNQGQIRFEDSQREFDRIKKLFEQGVVAESDFIKAETAYRTSREELEASENNLQIVREGVSKKEGAGTNTLIRSTVDGMVLDVPIKEGNSVIESNTFNDGTTVALVADMSSMVFEGQVDESEVGKIKEGMELELTVGAIENETFNAVLEYVSPKGNEEVGTIQFDIKAAVELKENAFIRAGYSANANIILASTDSIMAINEANMFFRNDSSFVEIETGEQKFEERYIETGLSDGINIEIKSGLEMSSKIKVRKQ